VFWFRNLFVHKTRLKSRHDSDHSYCNTGAGEHSGARHDDRRSNATQPTLKIHPAPAVGVPGPIVGAGIPGALAGLCGVEDLAGKAVGIKIHRQEEEP
jgi:hypothetical protein